MNSMLVITEWNYLNIITFLNVILSNLSWIYKLAECSAIRNFVISIRNLSLTDKITGSILKMKDGRVSKMFLTSNFIFFFILQN